MLCKTCGSQNSPGTKFCTECGAPLDQQEDVAIETAVDIDPNAAYGGEQGFTDAGAQNFSDPYQNPNQGYGNQGYGDPNYQGQGYNGQGYQNQGYQGQQYGGYGQQQYGGGYGQPMNASYAGIGIIQQRSILTCILLSFITCGLYTIYWWYTLHEDTNRLSSEAAPTSFGMVFLLSLVTCNIYYFYWLFKRGEIIDNYNMQRGLPSGSSGIIYLVLSLFGFGIVAYALMQNELNKIASGTI